MAIEIAAVPNTTTYGLATQLRSPDFRGTSYKAPASNSGSISPGTKVTPAMQLERTSHQQPAAVWSDKSTGSLNKLRRQKAHESLRDASSVSTGRSHLTKAANNVVGSPLQSSMHASPRTTSEPTSPTFRPIGDLAKTPLPPLPANRTSVKAPAGAHQKRGSNNVRLSPVSVGPLDLGIRFEPTPQNTYRSSSVYDDDSPRSSPKFAKDASKAVPQVHSSRASHLGSRRGSLDSILKAVETYDQAQSVSAPTLKDGPPPIIKRRHSNEHSPIIAQSNAASSSSPIMVPLAKRTGHVAWVPGYSWRLHLLERLETVSQAFMSIQEAEEILTIGNGPNSDGKTAARKSLIGMPTQDVKPLTISRPTNPARSSLLGKMKRALIHPSADRSGGKKTEQRKAVFGRPLSEVAKYAFITSIIAGQRHDLPGVAFATVEEIYRRGTGPKIPGLLQTAGDPVRLSKLIQIYDSPPDYGEHHDLASESVHDVCMLLKRYLASLPEPVLDTRLLRLYHAHCVNSSNPMKQRVAAAQLVLRLLPSANFSLMVYIVAFLTQIPLFPENRLSINSVAAMFGRALMAPRVTPTTVAARLSKVAAGTMTITAPTEKYEVEGQSAKRAEEGLVWLLENWSAIADSLLDPDFDIDVDNVMSKKLDRNLREATESHETLMIIGGNENGAHGKATTSDAFAHYYTNGPNQPVVIAPKSAAVKASNREASVDKSIQNSIEPLAREPERLDREDSEVLTPFIYENNLSKGPTNYQETTHDPATLDIEREPNAPTDVEVDENEPTSSPVRRGSESQQRHQAMPSFSSAKEFPALQALNEDIFRQPTRFESPTLKTANGFGSSSSPNLAQRSGEASVPPFVSDEFGPLGRTQEGSILDDYLTTENTSMLNAFPSPPLAHQGEHGPERMLLRGKDDQLRDAQTVHDAQRKEIQTLWKQLTTFEIERASTRSQLDELRAEIERMKRSSLAGNDLGQVRSDVAANDSACRQELAQLKQEHAKVTNALAMARDQLDLAERRHMEEQRKAQAQIVSLTSQLDGIRSVLGNVRA